MSHCPACRRKPVAMPGDLCAPGRRKAQAAPRIAVTTAGMVAPPTYRRWCHACLTETNLTSVGERWVCQACRDKSAPPKPKKLDRVVF
jgi:hypothetical protein